MDASAGLQRGTEVTDTGEPILVPVGPGTLGRIMNVIGEPIDERCASPRGNPTLASPAQGRFPPIAPPGLKRGRPPSRAPLAVAR